MKKTLKLLAIITVLVATMFALTGCKKDDKKSDKANTIVGSWKYEGGDYTYTFKEDGTGDYSYYGAKMEFTYKTEGNKLAITYNGSTAAFETEYSIDGDTLNVKDSFGKDTLYKKQ
jgi:uncharacterized protein (DUF2147 family)